MINYLFVKLCIIIKLFILFSMSNGLILAYRSSIFSQYKHYHSNHSKYSPTARSMIVLNIVLSLTHCFMTISCQNSAHFFIQRSRRHAPYPFLLSDGRIPNPIWPSYNLIIPTILCLSAIAPNNLSSDFFTRKNVDALIYHGRK